ncbi:MAG: hypothetical protein LBV54_04370 [Puniceicoccales bacterium]|jgi:hypothetical protein|nr:hypothetical protein [Puniceicoccales bacterium]
MKNFTAIFLLLLTATMWQGCASNKKPDAVVSVDPVVGFWVRDSSDAGAAASVIFETDHSALTRGGVIERWNAESLNFYKINHANAPAELFYLADMKTLYLLGYGGNAKEIINIVGKGYPLDDLHERGLLPFLVKYKRSFTPRVLEKVDAPPAASQN